jgi:cytochrome d ubiquinol oxidase subunit II
MTTAWFVFLAFMITMYVVLDGFDLGVGALHRVIGRSDQDRERIAHAIGPVWNGNEVWLIAGGGALFLAFPIAYAAAFSGLYIGLILVLWLLVGRGLGLELRRHVDDPLWRTACDTVFWLSSATLATVFGVALGNVVRGVPLRRDGYFHLPLFSILNWYAVLIGVVALVVLTAHGARFLAAKAEAEIARRAARWAWWLWWVELALVVVAAWPTYHVRHSMLTTFGDHPWCLVFPALAVGGLLATFVAQRRGAWGAALVGSGLFIAGLLAAMAAGLYPYVLPARAGQPFGLTIDNASTGPHALRVATFWWPLGILLAVVYFSVVYAVFVRGRRARADPPAAAP